MDARDREIREAIRKDTEAVPLQGLPSARCQVRGSRRFAALAEMLRPGDVDMAELYLTELLARSMRQVGGHLCLFTTFIRMVDDMDLEALPQTARQGLSIMVKRAKEKPVLVLEPRALAHALVFDGALAAWLRRSEYGQWRETLGVPQEAGLKDAQAAYRRLRREAHPDHGGDAGTFREIQHAWKQARSELGATA